MLKKFSDYKYHAPEQATVHSGVCLQAFSLPKDLKYISMIVYYF